MSILIELISDFNLGVLGRYLENDDARPACKVVDAGFNQVFQALTAAKNTTTAKTTVAVVWTRPEGVIPGIAAALTHRPFDHAAAIAETDAFADAVACRAAGCDIVLVPAWTLPPDYHGLGPLEYRPGLGAAHVLAACNLRLAERLATAGNVFILNAEPWLRAAGRQAGSPRQWFAGKTPFSNVVFRHAARDIRAALAGAVGLARRLVIVDLDNTLWGGVVGETGWEGIRLGGHDPAGEAFAAFQDALLALTRRGVLLGVVSKNDEATALAAFDRHSDMRLRRSDLAGWRINWGDKAANVAALTAELNLGLESVVFIDDNPLERGRVAEALPDVLVPDWPQDPALFVGGLRDLRCFDVTAVSDEDRRRAEMYTQERRRRTAQQDVGDPDDWLAGLDLQVTAQPLNADTLTRAAQLFNKTNQMNLSTRRLSPVELLAWSQVPGQRIWTWTVADRFGDSGLTGLLGVAMDGKDAVITDFILSCRVMGRRIEQAMAHKAVAYAGARGAQRIIARHLSTPRNGPCLAFWRESGFNEHKDMEFIWNGGDEYPLPKHISLKDLEND
jgi:FkbH-like protein